jgi:hypothetical protein
MWQAWINFILGVALLIIAYTALNATWIAIVGVLVIIFSLWGALGGGMKKM